MGKSDKVGFSTFLTNVPKQMSRFAAHLFWTRCASLRHTSHQGDLSSSGGEAALRKLRIAQFDAALAEKRGLSATYISACYTKTEYLKSLYLQSVEALFICLFLCRLPKKRVQKCGNGCGDVAKKEEGGVTYLFPAHSFTISCADFRTVRIATF